MARSQDQETVGSTVPDAGDAPDADREPRPSLSTFREQEQRFTLGDELGRGGMGRVIAAADVSLRRGVAIKQVLSHEPHDLIRFEREVRITAELEHPSIVPIYDVGIDGEDRPYYVMRRIDGVPLTDRLDGDSAARLALLPNVLSAIDAAAFAHARNIIHRDIKPSNILLGAYGETWLIDWGLARRLDEPEEVGDAPAPGTSLPSEQLTIAGQVYGTAAYMPPEQARGEAVDPRADVYALGATLFHVLSGRGPFHGVSAAQRIAQAIDGEAAPTQALPDATAPELKAIVGKAMGTDPATRYPDARTLASDLRAYLAGQLVGAHRYSARERFSRFTRRYRLALTIVVVALMLMITGAAFAVRKILGTRDDALAARSIAEDRANESQLDRASAMVDHDPTHAVAIVRNLAADPRYAHRARDIVAAAAAAGIAHGSTAQSSSIEALAFSPDRRSLVSGAEDGRITIYDVVTAQSREVARFPGFVTRTRNKVAFVDETTVLVMHGRERAMVVDTSTLKTTMIDDIADAWPMPGHRIAYVDGKRRVLGQIDLATGVRRDLADDVSGAAGDADAAIVFGESGARLITPAGTITLMPAKKNYYWPPRISISATLHRVALAEDASLVEWDFSGIELRRVDARVLWMIYGANGLYGKLVTGNFERIGSSVASPPARPGATARLGNGLAVITDENAIWFIEDFGARKLTTELSEPTTIAASDSMLAIGARDGTVRWWDTSTIWPRPIPVSATQAICQWDEHNIYVFTTPRELATIDRVTGRASYVMPVPAMVIPGPCEWMPNGNLIYRTPVTRPMIFDLASKRVLKLACSELRVDDKVVICGTKHDLMRVVSGEPRIVWHGDAEIEDFGLHRNWIIMELGRAFWRLDHETGALDHITDIAPNTDAVSSLVSDGSVFYSLGTTLWHWEPASGSRYVTTMSSPIDRVSALVDGVILIVLADGEIWMYDGTHLDIRASRSLSSLGVVVEDKKITVDGDQLVTQYLRTGERAVHKLPFPSNYALPHPGGVLIFGRNVVLIHEDPVPADVSELPSWIDRATNARHDRELGHLTWH